MAHGFAALAVNRPHEALEALSRVDPHSWTVRTPSYYWRDLTAAHHVLGQHEEELREARRAREHLPQVLEMLEYEIRALAAMGRLEVLRERLGEVTTFGSEAVGRVMRRIALELRAHGQPDAARDVLARAVAWYESRPPDEAATGGHRYDLAWVLHDAERWDEALVLIEQLIGEDPENIDYLGSLGTLSAREGRQDDARRIDRQLAQLERPYLQGINTLWRGIIAAQLGESERAVTLLRQAHSEGAQFGVGTHREPTLDPLRGYQPFEDFMTPKG
jgi:tetratricopeptide (TPR) repeat protein